MSFQTRVYLAGPFFNDRQIAAIQFLEDGLRERGHFNVFSPREQGVLSPEALHQCGDEVFANNLVAMDQCDIAVALVSAMDDRPALSMYKILASLWHATESVEIKYLAVTMARKELPNYVDLGTTFELGYLRAKGKPVVAVDFDGYRGTNLMLGHGVNFWIDLAEKEINPFADESKGEAAMAEIELCMVRAMNGERKCLSKKLQ